MFCLWSHPGERIRTYYTRIGTSTGSVDSIGKTSSNLTLHSYKPVVIFGPRISFQHRIRNIPWTFFNFHTDGCVETIRIDEIFAGTEHRLRDRFIRFYFFNNEPFAINANPNQTASRIRILGSALLCILGTSI